MKIVIAHYKYYVQGGPERYLFKFKELAERNGCEVIPFSINYAANEKSEYSKYFVGKPFKNGNFNENKKSLSYLMRGFLNEFHNKEAQKKLQQLIDDVKPDLLYCLIPGELTLDIFKVAKKNNIPSIMRISDFRSICGMYSMIRGDNVCELCLGGHYSNCYKHKCVKNSLVLSCLRAASLKSNRKHKRYSLVDAFITPPTFTKNLLVSDGMIPAEKIFFNPTFVDCSVIEPYFEHDNYVLCLGRFSKEKGFRYAVDAMKYFDNNDIKLYITGNKENADSETMRIIEENELQDRIVFLGFLHGEELVSIIKRTMAVLCPAIWYENMPNAIIEAYAYGKPVIASDVGSQTEMVVDGKTGYLFENKNSFDLFQCIKKLADNKEALLLLGKNARQECLTRYSPNKHWDVFLNVYEQLKGSHERKE